MKAESTNHPHPQGNTGHSCAEGDPARFEIEHLQRETEHYYQAELQHDQRASWIMGVAGVLLVFVLQALGGPSPGMWHEAEGWMWTCTLFLMLTVVLAVVSMWPLAGHEGRQWRPFVMPPGQTRKYVGDERPVACRHCDAHRRRAEKHAMWVMYTLLLLLAALLCAFIGGVIAAW
ncbi:hypothetical protein [Candidatus Thiosymbion oneisti]|uniref:hypothetical protein n=1 Tax=Candidatus Thiosymbion oneisti TaxID=589554 RepID=UPI00114D117A|nr:hypothetical protein [Candidatus Thiosymbion oneisti]